MLLAVGCWFFVVVVGLLLIVNGWLLVVGWCSRSCCGHCLFVIGNWGPLLVGCWFVLGCWRLVLGY